MAKVLMGSRPLLYPTPVRNILIEAGKYTRSRERRRLRSFQPAKSIIFAFRSRCILLKGVFFRVFNISSPAQLVIKQLTFGQTKRGNLLKADYPSVLLPERMPTTLFVGLPLR